MRFHLLPMAREETKDSPQATQHFSETEDEQLNRAMAMSMTESQTLPGQETGVTDLTKKAFGPAQREYYDNEKWSMTLPGTFAREILLNPEPIDRQRHPGTPAFLKPTPDAAHLAALIKILHEIPIAREALLNIKLLCPDYGHDPQWWDGEPVKQLRVVNVDQGYQDAYGQDLINEIQRLMAFLDRTERAYGSIEGITKLQSRQDEGERITTFLEDWQTLTAQLAPDGSLSTIFESRGLKRDPEEGDEKSQAFSCLPINVGSNMINSGFSLYDALDEVIWEGTDGSDVFLKDVGHIAIFSLTCLVTSGSEIGIDIPAVWYPDRYMEFSIVQAKEYRARKTALENRINDLAATREKLLKFQSPRKPAAEASSLLATAMTHFEQSSSYQNSTKTGADVDGSKETNNNIKSVEILEQLNDLNARITKKLEGKCHPVAHKSKLSITAFEQAKEELKGIVKKNALFYTKPTNDPDTSPTHKYTLRGVATTMQKLYVLEKVKPVEEDDLISLEIEEWQWWRLEYVSNDTKPVVTTKVSEDDVLRAARNESRNVLLVYADEHAIDYESTPLPSQLVNFVRMDNLSFQGELEDFVQPARESPGKRKAMSDDQDDLVIEHPRSPPFNRDHFSDDSLYPNPPDYDNTPPSSPPMHSFRTLKPKMGLAGSSDDTIPTSLRLSGQAMDPTYAALDQDDMGQSSQEMQERSGGSSLLQTRNDISEGYKLGDYVPEIDMDEADDEGAQNEKSPQARGRGTRDDTW